MSRETEVEAGSAVFEMLDAAGQWNKIGPNKGDQP